MKKTIAFLPLVLALIFLGGLAPAFAESGASSPTIINARILPTVWYSSLSVEEGQSVKIFAGVQNNSGKDFTGVASFYVDGNSIAEIPFSSAGDSLKDVSASWTATGGTHDVAVKISAALPAGEVLFSAQSDKSSLDVGRKITLQDVQNVAGSAASSIVSAVNGAADNLANQVESLKKPAVSGSSAGAVASSSSSAGKTGSGSSIQNLSKSAGNVLGAFSGSGTFGQKAANAAQGAFNLAMDGLAFLIRNWPWTLAGIFLLYLVFRFF